MRGVAGVTHPFRCEVISLYYDRSDVSGVFVAIRDS